MRTIFSLAGIGFALAFMCAFLSIGAGNVIAQSTLAGTVNDKAGHPLPDIDVELLDEYYRMRARMKTSSTGRYEFGGLQDGRWYVRVYAFRYDLEDETHEVLVTSVSAVPGRPGVSYNLEDFYLQPKKGGLRDTELSVIFAQDVPREAQRVYEKAIDDLGKKKDDEGFSGLQKAIELYPNYYNAYLRFGNELFLRQQYMPAAQAFLKAGEINPKSAIAMYYAGYALYMLGNDYYKAAGTAASEAVRMAPLSAAANLLLGSIERKRGDLTSAQKHLEQAKKSSPSKTAEIHRELAQLYGDMKKYKEAADELEQYIRVSKMTGPDAANARKVVVSLRAKASRQEN